jgi:hypothetical protein
MSTSIQSAESKRVPCVEGSLPEMRRLAELCETADIAAELVGEACAKPGCSPKVQLCVAPEDLPRVAELLRQRWNETLAREGLTPVASVAVPEGAEPPCPACGAAAALVNGACGDCGLQLE